MLYYYFVSAWSPWPVTFWHGSACWVSLSTHCLNKYYSWDTASYKYWSPLEERSKRSKKKRWSHWKFLCWLCFSGWPQWLTLEKWAMSVITTFQILKWGKSNVPPSYQNEVVIEHWGLKMPCATENSTWFLGVTPNMNYIWDKRTKPQLTLGIRASVWYRTTGPFVPLESPLYFYACFWTVEGNQSSGQNETEIAGSLELWTPNYDAGMSSQE